MLSPVAELQDGAGAFQCEAWKIVVILGLAVFLHQAFEFSATAAPEAFGEQSAFGAESHHVLNHDRTGEPPAAHREFVVGDATGNQGGQSRGVGVAPVANAPDSLNQKREDRADKATQAAGEKDVQKVHGGKLITMTRWELLLCNLVAIGVSNLIVWAVNSWRDR